MKMMAVLWLAIASGAALPLGACAGKRKPAPATKVACTMLVSRPGKDEVAYRMAFVVDGAGRLSEQQIRDDNGAVYTLVSYRRDQRGRIVEKCQTLRRDGKEVPFQCYHPRYRESAQLPFETEMIEQDGMRGSLSRHSYDESGRETIRVTERGLSNVISSEFHYRADGRLEEIRHTSDRWNGFLRYRRSPAGDVIEMVNELGNDRPTVSRYPTPWPEAVLADARLY
jgi:hypothetical protein